MANCFKCEHLKKAKGDFWQWECHEVDTYFSSRDEKTMKFINCNDFDDTSVVKHGRHVVHTSMVTSDDYTAVVATCRDGTVWAIDPTEKDNISSKDWIRFPDIPQDEIGESQAVKSD